MSLSLPLAGPPSLPAGLAKTLRTLLAGKRRILVATSGGPDSQALLHWSAAVAAELDLVHLGGVGLDHGLRAAAGQELDLAAALCAQLGLGFVRQKLAPFGRGNLMQAARLARRQALLALAQQLGAEAILLGHTANDQAETVLQHLARGAGLRGAAGMAARQGRQGCFVRPWLQIERTQVLAYAAAHRLAYAQDPSNHDLRRSRAAVRARVLPALESLYAGATMRLGAFAAKARAENAFVAKLARKAGRRCLAADGRLQLTNLLALPAVLQARVLHAWLVQAGAQASTKLVSRLLEHFARAARGERAWPLAQAAVPGAWLQVELAACSGAVFLRARPPSSLPARRLGPRPPQPAGFAALSAQLLQPGGRYLWGRWRIEATLGPAPQQKDLQALCTRQAHAVAIAADRPHLCLGLRSWREGDRLRPFGLDGHTRVSDLFTNAKVPRHLRLGWPVVTLADEVVWVVGLRRGCQAPLSAATQTAWVLHAFFQGSFSEE